jgi:hypothetical protein
MKKLNIQVDPWDNYLYFDSKFFFDFLFKGGIIIRNLSGNNSNSTSVPGVENTEEKFIHLKFLFFVYHNDFLPNFKADGKVIASRLTEYYNLVAQDDDYVKIFVKRVLLQKEEPKEEEIEKFETKLEMIFDLFLQDLTNRKMFSEIKEDYFKL